MPLVVRSNRAALSTLCCCALAMLTACAASPVVIEPEEEASNATVMVEIQSLARDLSLEYRIQGGGIIELRKKPDNVIFIPESRTARINGTVLEMDRPLMRRGSGYILTGSDAVLVSRTLKTYRSERAAANAPKVVVARRGNALPYSWRPRVRARDWRAIVVHHTASGAGSRAAIHRMHRARGWDGIGYHFVIGNGTLTQDGKVELGYRWKTQEVAAHCKAPRNGDKNWWNRRSIGVCLIGDFTSTRPTPAQMDSLVRVIRTLMDEYGIPLSEIRQHGHIKVTACPGAKFPWNQLMRRLR
jgi:N-acetylmuramoyl-L-alanine amidase